MGRFWIYQNVPADGSWTEWGESTIRMVWRPQVWYLMLADCGENSHSRHPTMPPFQIEILAKNDESHFSEEHWYIVQINLLVFAFLVFYLGFSGVKLLKEFKLGESLEQPMTFLTMAVFTESVLIVLELVNNLVFYYDGTNIFLISLFTSAWRIGTQCIMFSIILMIASGWSLTF